MREPESKTILKDAFAAAKIDAEVEVYKAAHGWCPPDTTVYDRGGVGARLEPHARDVRQSARLSAADRSSRGGRHAAPVFFGRACGSRLLESSHGKTNAAHHARGLPVRAALVARARGARALAESDGLRAAQRDADRRRSGRAPRVAREADRRAPLHRDRDLHGLFGARRRARVAGRRLARRVRRQRGVDEHRASRSGAKPASRRASIYGFARRSRRSTSCSRTAGAERSTSRSSTPTSRTTAPTTRGCSSCCARAA